MTPSYPLVWPTRTVNRDQMRAMLAPAPSLGDWARLVLPQPLQRYQVDLLNRMDEAHAAGQQRWHILPGKQAGRTHFRQLYEQTKWLVYYLIRYGEPWAVAMRAPEHVRSTPITRALRTLYPLKRESR